MKLEMRVKVKVRVRVVLVCSPEGAIVLRGWLKSTTFAIRMMVRVHGRARGKARGRARVRARDTFPALPVKSAELGERS